MESKKLSRREFLKVAATGIGGAAFLAACVPVTVQQQAGTGAAAVEEKSVEAPPAEEITLSFGHHWEAAFRPRQDEFDEKYLEAHPNIKFEITYNTWSDHNQIVPTWAAAGTLPDIIYVHGRYAFPWNYEGVMVSAQDYIDADPEFNVEGIWEESLRLYRFKGKQYEIPYDHGPIILGYNKDIFDQHGYPYPDDTWTMDDFVEAAKTLNDPENQQWGWAGSYPNFGNENMPAMLGGWGAQAYNDEETKLMADSPEAIEAMQFWADLILEEKVAPTPAESQAFEQGPWISGVIAMSPVASWSTPTLHSFAPFNWDVAPWPKGPVAQQTGSFGSGFGITRDSQHPDEGWDYLREYLSVAGMEFMWGETGRGSPARKEAYESWLNSEPAPEHAEAFLGALDNYAITGRPYQTLAGAEILDILNRETDLIRSGEKTVEEAVAAIMADGQPVLDEAAERLGA
jgi:multiple sugar transport system substrate-binding protein